MLIRQSQLLGEATAFLDSIDRLALEESTYDPHMVTVRHNTRLGQDLVQLESFLGFAQANGIDDAGLALHRVCEANDVPRNSLAFLVNEESIYADDEICETFAQLQEAGFPCHVARISEVNPYYTRLLEALALDEDVTTFEESTNLQKYINESIIDTAKQKAGDAYDTAKNKVKSGVDAVAKKLASVKRAIAEKMEQAKKLPASGKAFAIRQIDKLKKVAAKLKAKLVELKNSAKGKVTAAATTIKDTAGRAGETVKGAASTVAKKAGEAYDAAKSKAGELKDRFFGGSDSKKMA